MNISAKEKMTEAVDRMKKFGLYSEVIEQFKNGYINVSEPPFGACFWADDELLEEIRKLEEEYGILVYHVIRARTTMGILDSLLYVSDHKDEWEYDNADLADGYAMTYTINHDCPYFSEFGSIAIKTTVAGGLRRVG